MSDMQQKMKHATFIAAVALATAAFAAPAQHSAWSVEIAPLARLSRQSERLGKVLGNQMLFVLIVTGAQQYFSSNYGAFNADRPLAFRAFRAPDGNSLDVALVYPGNDSAAAMVLHTPGSEKTISGGVCIKPGALYAAFDKPHGVCAFATSEETARAALAEPLRQVPDDAIALCSWRGNSLAVKTDKDGLFTETNLMPGSQVRFPDNIPVLSLLVPKGATTNKITRVKFADVKSAVLELAKQTMNPGGGAQK